MSRVAATSPLRLGHPRGRSFGAALDRALEPLYSSHDERSTGDIESLSQMLQMGRIDYFRSSSPEEEYLARTQPKHQTTIHLPLEESHDLLSHEVACARTAWGAKIVERVNHQFELKELRQKFQGYYEGWLGPEELKLYRVWLSQTAQPGQ